MGVYDYVDSETAQQDNERVFVKVKWVRVNKEPKTTPQMKCGLVAQELACGTRMQIRQVSVASSCHCGTLHTQEKAEN